jgi:hypothetical protein
MARQGHKVFVYSLFLLATAALVVPMLHGFDYYVTPLVERPFHPQYDELKPSGYVGHGYGVVGSIMIIAGVTLYSSRKRIRVFAGVGKLPAFLETHIFLCLTGPILIVYHTTFKFGGLVSVSFWSMTTIVLSGLVGRYLYVQIPRGIQGHELSVAELDKDLGRIGSQLIREFGLSESSIKQIDDLSNLRSGKPITGLPALLWFIFIDDVVRSRAINRKIRMLGVRKDLEQSLDRAFHARHLLHRRIQLLEQVRKFFHYWHVIHVPFSIIMFAILLVHVVVAVALGYLWIF